MIRKFVIASVAALTLCSVGQAAEPTFSSPEEEKAYLEHKIYNLEEDLGRKTSQSPEKDRQLLKARKERLKQVEQEIGKRNKAN